MDLMVKKGKLSQIQLVVNQVYISMVESEAAPNIADYQTGPCMGG